MSDKTAVSTGSDLTDVCLCLPIPILSVSCSIPYSAGEALCSSRVDIVSLLSFLLARLGQYLNKWSEDPQS